VRDVLSYLVARWICRTESAIYEIGGAT